MGEIQPLGDASAGRPQGAAVSREAPPPPPDSRFLLQEEEAGVGPRAGDGGSTGRQRNGGKVLREKEEGKRN